MSDKQDVIFTGTRDGLYLVLNDRQDLDTLKEKIKSHLEKSELFFQGAQVVLDVGRMNLDIDEILDIQNTVFAPHGLKIRKVIRGSGAGALGRVATRNAEKGRGEEVGAASEGRRNDGTARDAGRGRVSDAGYHSGREKIGGSEFLGSERREALYQEVTRKILEGPVTRGDLSYGHRGENAPETRDPEVSGEDTLLYRGTVRSGQKVYHPGNIVVLGDVNPGAFVQAGGDIVVMGALRGIAHAGAGGNVQSAIYALRLEPTQIRIANVIGRPPDGEIRSHSKGPETARLKDGAIIIEAMENAR